MRLLVSHWCTVHAAMQLLYQPDDLVPVCIHACMKLHALMLAVTSWYTSASLQQSACVKVLL